MSREELLEDEIRRLRIQNRRLVEDVNWAEERGRVLERVITHLAGELDRLREIAQRLT